MSKPKDGPLKELTAEKVKDWTLKIVQPLCQNNLEILWVWRMTCKETLEKVNVAISNYNQTLEYNNPNTIQEYKDGIGFALVDAEKRIKALLDNRMEYYSYLDRYLEAVGLEKLGKMLPDFGYPLSILFRKPLSEVKQYAEFLKELESNDGEDKEF